MQIYAEGQKWYDDPSYPCKQFTCTKAGVVKTRDLTDKCDELEPPDCRTERDLGQCCKRCVPKRQYQRRVIGGERRGRWLCVCEMGLGVANFNAEVVVRIYSLFSTFKSHLLFTLDERFSGLAIMTLK